MPKTAPTAARTSPTGRSNNSAPATTTPPSEALAGTLKVLEALLVQLPNLAAQEQFARILAFANRPRTPILIEAHDVPEALLRAEQGGRGGPVLEFIESAL